MALQSVPCRIRKKEVRFRINLKSVQRARLRSQLLKLALEIVE